MGFYRNQYEAEQEGYNYEAYQRLNEELKQEAAAMGVPYEQYKLGHTLWMLNGSREAAEKRKLEQEKAEREAHHKEQQRRATIRNASVSELMSSMIAKAPLAIFSDVRAYLDTGHMPEPLKEWVIAQFDGVKQ